MLKERTAVRLDEETRVKLERFVKQHGTTLSDIVREAINEYLKEKELTWAKIDYEIVPFIQAKFVEKGFRLVDVIKPAAGVERLLAKRLPVVLCFEYDSKRLDVKITFEQVKGGYMINVEIPLVYTVQLENYVETSQGTTIRGYVDKIRDKVFEALLTDAVDELVEYFSLGKIEARERSVRLRHELKCNR